jgi:hypothetical protein
MDKVWIVEEIRKDMTTAIMGVHSTLASAQEEVREWEEIVKNDGSGELYTITVMRVRGAK